MMYLNRWIELLPLLLALQASAVSLRAQDAPSPAMPPAKAEKIFGSETLEHGALIGILYDLKLNPQRERTAETQKSYLSVIERFLEDGWNESVLNRFYRTSRALHTTQIWIPTTRAERAPEAFGVANVVQPTMWLVHYKGQVSPPEDGTYRFVGVADNVLCVAVNQQTQLVSYIRGSELKPKNWTAQDPSNAWMPVKREKAFNGTWFQAKQKEVLDLDILMGERPGGGFYAFLMIEKQGEQYPVAEDGRTRLPPFHLQANTLTSGFPKGRAWTGHQ